MITETVTSFPCEEATRCFLSCKALDDRRLSSKADGTVSISSDRNSSEEWTIVLTGGCSGGDDGRGGGDGIILALRSVAHGKYLRSSPEGKVDTTEEAREWEQWRVETLPNGAGDSVSLVSAEHGTKLCYDVEKGIFCATVEAKVETLAGFLLSLMYGFFSLLYQFVLGGESPHHYEWSVDFLSGELCFLSSPMHNRRVRCNPLGNIGVTENWKGWEVWRFIEAGGGSNRGDDGGHVYISSWTHHDRLLSAEHDGRVCTTESKNRGLLERWMVEKATNGNGVVIKSVAHGTVLGTDGNNLYTKKEEKATGAEIWHLESANRSKFYIVHTLSGECAGCRPGEGKSVTPLTTKNRGTEEQWSVAKAKLHGEAITLYSSAQGMYLGTSRDGEVTLSTNAEESELWSVRRSPEHGLFLVSIANNVYLTRDEGGRLCTVSGGERMDTSAIWRLDPLMPESKSGAVVGTMIAVGAVTAACAVAMPFAIMGVIGGLGFTAEGIAAGSAAAGMMSAEAIASGGGVAAGGMVATLQSIGAVGLGVVGTGAAVGGGALIGGSVSAATAAGVGHLRNSNSSGEDNVGSDSHVQSGNRPFCEWRSW